MDVEGAVGGGGGGVDSCENTDIRGVGRIFFKGGRFKCYFLGNV